MRIAQIANIAERVPPKKYGGTERVIYTLTEELVKRGHDVTLFATGDSITSAKLVSVFPSSLREAKIKDIYGFNLYSLLNMGLAYKKHRQFDIIHDHNPHMGLPVANVIDTPVVSTWHGPFTPEISDYFSKLNKSYLVGISKSQADHVTGINLVGTVYNGLYMENYPFSETHEGYLLFVGRISKEKGLHIAMEAAIKLNIPLIIAAKLDRIVLEDMHYFYRQINPRLKKYPDLLKWVGEVDEEERNKLMSKAMCLLHPVTWPEPFGLVLIESMACGAPVVAINKGAIPEIVVHNQTGFVANNMDELLDGIKKINTINRSNCRIHALTNFSAQKMASGYEKIYERILLESGNKHDQRTGN